MRVYSVHPGEAGIKVSDGRTLAVDGGAEWGTRTIQCAHTYRVIILDVLGAGREIEASRLMQRFKWRANDGRGVMKWVHDQPAAITEAEVKAVVDSIKETEESSRPMVQKMAREQPNATDSYGNPLTDRLTRDQEWKTNPDVRPNIPTEKKDG
jgi:hypothetical protein